jgi:hypothetical protein
MKIASLLSSVLLTGCSVFGVRAEHMPPYTVLAQVGAVEVRQYGPRVVAETTVQADTMAARSIGFRRLAGYIFGGNHGGVSIEMTAPVGQSTAGQTIPMTAPVAQQGSTIRFFMPATYTLGTLPQPNDPQVRLAELPAQTVAVLRFTGSTAPDAVAEESGKLLRALQGNAWRPVGAPFAWFYDPPWTLPWLRRNEVGVEVSRG